MNPDMDAIYILSPQPHIVDCLLADFERRRYRRGFIIWTALLPDALQRRLDGARRHMGGMHGTWLVLRCKRGTVLLTCSR